jgi:hypothetical protein
MEEHELPARAGESPNEGIWDGAGWKPDFDTPASRQMLVP